MAKPTRATRVLVSLTVTSWNQIGEWLRRIDQLRQIAGANAARTADTGLAAPPSAFAARPFARIEVTDEALLVAVFDALTALDLPFMISRVSGQPFLRRPARHTGQPISSWT
jgi:hypothetical protein